MGSGRCGVGSDAHGNTTRCRTTLAPRRRFGWLLPNSVDSTGVVTRERRHMVAQVFT